LRERVGAAQPEQGGGTVTRTGDARALARDGLLGLGYDFGEVQELLDGASGESPEELIADALRSARR